jgi:hypothetical protein
VEAGSLGGLCALAPAVHMTIIGFHVQDGKFAMNHKFQAPSIFQRYYKNLKNRIVQGALIVSSSFEGQNVISTTSFHQ